MNKVYLNSLSEKYLEGLSRAELIKLVTDLRENPVKDNTKPVISSASAVAELYGQEEFDRFRENMFILLLNSDLTLYRSKLISSGSENAIQSVSLSVLYKEILSEKSPVNKFILVHNHPSGDPAPSSADISFTTEIVKGCGLLDLQLLDHVIIGTASDSGSDCYYSLQSSGML